MAIIYTYPRKLNPTTGDLLLISDVSASNASRKITIGDLKDPLDVVDKITDINGANGQTGDIKLSGSNTIDIDFNAGANSITFDTKNLTSGTGTANRIPKWSSGNVLTDSIYIFPIAVGTAGQVLALPTPIGSSPYQLAWTDNTGGGRTCNLTITSTATNETLANSDNGQVSIAITGGIANYGIQITHTDSTAKTQTATTLPIVFTGLKPGTWTISGLDNEPSGTTKCPLSGTFSISAAACAISAPSIVKVNTSGAGKSDGEATITVTNALQPLTITITPNSGSATTLTGSSPIKFTGLAANTYSLTGNDNFGSSPNCTIPSASFIIADSASSTTLQLTASGEGYTTEQTYKGQATTGDGTGMTLSVAAEDGSSPTIISAGTGYENNDTIEVVEISGENRPSRYASYSVKIS